MISPVNPELLHQHINKFNSLTSSDEEAMEEDGEKRFISFEEMDGEWMDMVTELEDGDEDFTHELAVQAVNELGIVGMGMYLVYTKPCHFFHGSSIWKFNSVTYSITNLHCLLTSLATSHMYNVLTKLG